MDIDKLLARQIRAMNRHLAVEKLSLADLLSQDKPRVMLRDGSVHHFQKEELEFLSSLLSERERKILRLPIYIELSSSRFGKGTARVCGRAEVKVISAIIGRESPGDEIFVYKPEIKAIRKKLPTTTQYMFTTTLD